MAAKEDTLKENGSYNNSFERVSAGIFKTNPFFDRKDVVQVKYEMIRAASHNEGSVTEIADAYGFSRKSYYQINETFKTGGIAALIPLKTGPKGAFKLTPEVLAFIDSYIADHKNAKPKDISAALMAEKGVNIHIRTIYRYLKKN
jgi:transposase